MSSRIPVKHLTALVVDDSELLQSIYGTVLRSYARELEIYTASDGRKALLQLHQHPDTDVIVLDINMPEMNGLEFLRQIRNERAFSDTAVILVSTEDKQNDVTRGLAAGANAYVIKPFMPEQIHRALDNVLGANSRGGGVGDEVHARTSGTDGS